MPQDRRSSPNRSALGYWVPLVMTVTVATFGIAAWVWKERNDSDEDHDYYRRDHDNGSRPRRDDDYPGGPAPGYTGQPPPGHTSYAPGAEPGAPPPGSSQQQGEDLSMFARVMRRTPSPKQAWDGASKKVAAGVAAAGAVMGGALSSIREEDHHYEDHSRWMEQRAALQRDQIVGGSASAPAVPTVGRPGAHRRTVAIVVSADSSQFEADTALHSEHASILSHLPEHIDDEARVFILIFAPGLKQHPLSLMSSNKPAPSVASSYSHIGEADLQTPGEEEDEKPLTQVDPQPTSSSLGGLSTDPNNSGSNSWPAGSTIAFRALYSQAQALAHSDTAIMPFTTPAGWVQMVKHLRPDTVYVQARLSGPRGDNLKEIGRWVGQSVLVVGDDTGHGGLVDSEDEHGAGAGAGTGGADAWWQNDPAVGLGRGIEVVEGMRIGEDWRRRVKGHD